MAQSRRNGDIFEAAIVVELEANGLVPASSALKKATQLKTKYEELSIGRRTRLSNQLHAVIPGLLAHVVNPTEYKLVGDNRAKKGARTTTADIIVVAEDDDLYISCKSNSYSLKHQRPSGLPNQLSMGKSTTKRFIKEYKAINNRYYDRFDGCTAFREVRTEQIEWMYKRFNQLVSRYIEEAPDADQIEFVKFLLGVEDCNKVLVMLIEGEVVVYKMSELAFDSFEIEVDGKNILIETPNGDINMRLHTASSKITKKLSLKYDTKIKGDFEDFFHKL